MLSLMSRHLVLGLANWQTAAHWPFSKLQVQHFQINQMQLCSSCNYANATNQVFLFYSGMLVDKHFTKFSDCIVLLLVCLGLGFIMIVK